MTTGPIVILMAGMPGAGKSTIARAVGREFESPVIDKDVLVSALLDEGIPEANAHPAAYRTFFDLARDLVVGQSQSVILDSPGATEHIIRSAAEICADGQAHFVTLLCYTESETRFERASARAALRSHEARRSTKPGPALDRFAHLPEDKILLDTSGSLGDVVRTAIEAVRDRIESGSGRTLSQDS